MKPTGKEGIERKEEHLSEYIAELKDRQRNTVWPDMLRGSRGVDSLLWKGNEDAPPVQRIGIAVFGLAFLVAGMSGILLGIENKDLLEIIFFSVSLLVPALLFRNALRGLPKKRKKQ